MTEGYLRAILREPAAGKSDEIFCGKEQNEKHAPRSSEPCGSACGGVDNVGGNVHSLCGSDGELKKEEPPKAKIKYKELNLDGAVPKSKKS